MPYAGRFLIGVMAPLIIILAVFTPPQLKNEQNKRDEKNEEK